MSESAAPAWFTEHEAEVRAEIDRLHAEHPRESCDLFRTVTGKCSCRGRP